MIEATNTSLAQAGIEERPENLLADAGYASEENFAALDENDPDCSVATRNLTKNPKPRTGSRGPLKNNATEVDRMDPTVSTKKGNAFIPAAPADHRAGLRADQASPWHSGFSRRGTNAADAEWKLICGTHNLLKLYRRALTDPTAAPFSRIGAPATA